MNYQPGSLSSPLLNNRRYGGGEDDYRRESSSNSNATRQHRKSNRKSKSPELPNNRYNNGGGVNSAEARVQSLSSQLAAAQSQILQMGTELSNTRTAKNHAEHRLITLQRDYNALQTRNSELISVMKTLESGVEALQKDKMLLVTEREDLKAKLEAAEKNSAILNEQVSYLNERNSTLSKKCVDLLDGSKDFREKAITYEEELKHIKPRFEEMDAKFNNLNEQNKSISTRLNMYEMRERIWIREKTELEQRHKETIEKWQRSISDLRAQHESEKEKAVRTEKEKWRASNPSINAPTKGEMEKVERHIKDLQAFVESINAIHKTELDRYQKRILELEKLCQSKDLEQQSKDNGNEGKPKQCNGISGATNGDDDEVVIIKDGNDLIGIPKITNEKEEGANNAAC